MLGIVNLDLFVPELNFVFGLAQSPGKRREDVTSQVHSQETRSSLCNSSAAAAECILEPSGEQGPIF